MRWNFREISRAGFEPRVVEVNARPKPDVSIAPRGLPLSTAPGWSAASAAVAVFLFSVAPEASDWAVGAAYTGRGKTSAVSALSNLDPGTAAIVTKIFEEFDEDLEILAR